MSYESTELLLRLASLGDIDGLERLLTNVKTLNVNDQDKYGNFAALTAARRNDLTMLTLLVNHGADLEAKDGSGRTVDGWAKYHKNDEMIKFIEKTLVDNKDLKKPNTLSAGLASRAATGGH